MPKPTQRLGMILKFITATVFAGAVALAGLYATLTYLRDTFTPSEQTIDDQAHLLESLKSEEPSVSTKEREIVIGKLHSSTTISDDEKANILRGLR